ncbi:DUF2382 domain-containing protein [Cryptosporangium aurantiacum]|uniref:Conserved domain-containing protein n=1 Tax=Cryptosporangium aurantiacum TaxID=134849 RepID=A0A1M7RLM9_9ACTN|nr:PRC and DUF2382 domain-containing protein [Cryptosporangium aurantiacum]SHN47026.1 conserved domain-containing protein [Cryptosporangium aurantiacum]
MLTKEQLPRVMNATACDPAGDKIGTIAQVYLDEETNQPEFATIRTGLFGTKESFVPLADAEIQGDRVLVSVDKEQVRAAPTMEPDGPRGGLTDEQIDELYRHYHLSSPHGDIAAAEKPTPYGAPMSHGTSGASTAGRTEPRSKPTPPGMTRKPGADDAMTRSEERMRVGTRAEETGRVRLRKYVVTEHVQQTVPVSHEEVRLEREPITAANRDAALSGPEITEAEHEVVLHAERPVVRTETVPVERVRLAKETVTGTETVRGEVRKEQVELDDPGDAR